MKQLQLIVSILLGLLLVTSAHAAYRNLVVAPTSAQAQKRVALVIGNATYQGTTALRNPVNDAKAMSEALNALGFEVIEVTDATEKEMLRAITAFGSKLNSETAALFFYAGHGIQVRGKNYIIPVDAQIETEAAVATEAISVDAVLEQLNASPVSIVILDACRNNPFERSFRKMGGGLAQMDAPKGSFIAYATAPGKTAADGDSKHGLFTQELLKQIEVPGLKLEEVFKRVRANVLSKSGDTQNPWDSSDMTGDFYFKPTQVASLEPVLAPSPVHVRSKEEIEQETWDSARDSNDIDAIKEYLRQYPKGRFTGQAKVLIATLKKSAHKHVVTAEPSQSPVGNDREDSLWTEVQKGNSKEDYQAYLDQHPKGKYVALAKSRIKKLQAEAQAALDKQEQDSWQAAHDENSEESYGRYLKGYPNGRYAGLAKARQEKLKNDLAAKEEEELWKKADSNNDKTLVEIYLNQYPSGRYVAAASTKLKAIKDEEAKGPAMVSVPSRNYEIGKYDVTRGEFAKFVSETGYDAGNSCYIWTGSSWDNQSGSNWRNPEFAQDDTHPVTCVNWNDAQAYVTWLAKKTSRQYRLPTISEWEYACYGGNQTKYCGGDDINAVAWYKDNSGNQTHPVGQKQANGYGLYDMSGNVRQLIDNEQGGYTTRGSGWDFNIVNIVVKPVVKKAHKKHKVAINTISEPPRFSVYGFRLARTLPTESAQPATQQAELPKGYVSQGGLTWMPINTSSYTWDDAHAYCTNTAINGRTGWRLPTEAELKSLYASGAMNNHGWTLTWTWSSTPDSAGRHYNVRLTDGDVGGGANVDTNKLDVTCVR
jgi:formylglycine-generating enzyme required for sulfatase activity